MPAMRIFTASFGTETNTFGYLTDFLS